MLRARVCIKRSGKEFEQFRNDLLSSYVSRSREIPLDVIEADRQMVYYKRMVCVKKKSEEINGS